MKLIKFFLLLLSFIIINGCANQLPPSGGPPDKIPPEIIISYPVDGTTNFDDDHIAFEFSEYIDKRTFQEAVFISPKIEGKIEYDWSGTEVNIYFNSDLLKKNTTYTINLGTDIVDLNNRNKMLQSYTLTFSTGDSIDYGEINGKIYSESKNNIMVYAYIDNGDTINPIVRKPDYLTQSGKDGGFLLKGLKYGNYEIFAFSDELRDLLYNVGEDSYSVADTTVNLSFELQKIGNISFLMTTEDTIKPAISLITMTDKNHILIEFSEFVDSTKLKTDNFYLFDSTDSKKISIDKLFKNSKLKTYFVTISDSLNADNEIYFVADSIYDKSNNIKINDQLFLAQNKSADTIKPKINKLITRYDENKIDFADGYFTVNFNDGVNVNKIIDSSLITDSKGELIKYKAERIDDATILYTITQKLKPKTKYKFKILTDNVFDSAGNKIDSLYKADLLTINDLDFSGVSGTVNSKSNTKKVIEIYNKDNKYSQNISNNKFNFSRVIPGKYLMWMFEDTDSSGTYNYGKVYPKKNSEKFNVYPDTLNLRARWPVGDIEFDVN
ncbi:MAG: Ig-like domain-containing protein [bacterium]